MQSSYLQNKLSIFATVFIILFGIYYIPIDTRGDLGPVKLTLMSMSIVVLLLWSFKFSKAMIVGTMYVIYQIISASFHPESMRWSTLLYSIGLVYTYVCFYNLVYVERVFTIDHFIKIVKGVMLAYFIVCIIQQSLIIVGIKYLPLANLCQVLNRGIGCNSLSMEPSTFARFMLVFYYAYVKCQEYKQGQGPFSVKELFSGEHKWVTIRFLWMMCTMGSGTAFGALVVFSLYFVRKHNWFYVVPLLLAIYIVLPFLHVEQLDRSIVVINATTTLDQEQVEQADGSGASRISPLLNSLKADFSKIETWFGHGVDYSRRNNLFVQQSGTLFDDYGLVFYLLGLLFNFTCAYRFLSLPTIFMFLGLGGGSGTNIQYAWELMMVFTCVRYFYENMDYLESEDDVEAIDDNPITAIE